MCQTIHARFQYEPKDAVVVHLIINVKERGTCRLHELYLGTDAHSQIVVL